MTRAFNDYQLRHFRGLQGLLLQRADLVSSSDLMSLQEKIEQWICKQMDMAVRGALGGLGMPFDMIMVRMLPHQVIEFREMQAEAFLIARDRSFEMWREKQFEIERWVQEQVDLEVLKWTQPFIKVSGN